MLKREQPPGQKNKGFGGYTNNLAAVSGPERTSGPQGAWRDGTAKPRACAFHPLERGMGNNHWRQTRENLSRTPSTVY